MASSCHLTDFGASGPPGTSILNDFGMILGQNRTHARVLARFHLQHRAHARVLALFDAKKWPKRARERDSAGGTALKRARECDSDLKSVPDGPKTVQNRTRRDPKTVQTTPPRPVRDPSRQKAKNFRFF